MATNRFYSMKSVTNAILHEQDITVGQKKTILMIEEYTPHKFSGSTLREASSFIGKYKSEADAVKDSKIYESMSSEDRRMYKNGIPRPVIEKIHKIEEKLSIKYSSNWRPIRSDAYKFVEKYGGCLYEA